MMGCGGQKKQIKTKSVMLLPDFRYLGWSQEEV